MSTTALLLSAAAAKPTSTLAAARHARLQPLCPATHGASPSLLTASREQEAATARSLERGTPQPRAALDRSATRVKWQRYLIAYLFWLLLPLGGAHHVFLGRNRDALTCWVSLGGFGVGWLVDLVRIPRYCRELAVAESAEASELELVNADPLPSPRRRRVPRNSLEDRRADDDADATHEVSSASSAGARLGGGAALCWLLGHMCWQLLLGAWLTYHALRLLPLEASMAGGAADVARCQRAGSLLLSGPPKLTCARCLLPSFAGSRPHFSPSCSACRDRLTRAVRRSSRTRSRPRSPRRWCSGWQTCPPTSAACCRCLPP